MRASDLLNVEVHDEHGKRLGKVHDIRLVQDAPSSEGSDLTFRVDALLVGSAGFATRLGYTRNQVQGPWLIRVLTQRRERRTDEIPWRDLDLADGRLIRRKVS